MRSLNGSKIKDRVSNSSLLTKFNMFSVNQLNASIKMLEIWKAINVEDYPLKVEKQTSHKLRVSTRADIMEKPIEIGNTAVVQKTCMSDAIHLWNMAPE